MHQIYIYFFVTSIRKKKLLAYLIVELKYSEIEKNKEEKKKVEK